MAKQNASTNRSYELKKLKAACVAEENKKYIASQHFRKSGSAAAEPGNKVKATPGEVFLFIVGGDEEGKALQEQFKASKNFKKTKLFATIDAVKGYIGKSKFPGNSIICVLLIVPGNASQEDVKNELACVANLKESDPSIDVMLLSPTPYEATGLCDFVVLKNSEMFGKIVSNITWAIREQNRIRKQVESKQFIKAAIIIFFVFFFLIFAIDFVSGMLNPMRRGVLGIVPIPQP